MQFFVVFENFARAYSSQIALEIIWLPIQIALLEYKLDLYMGILRSIKINDLLHFFGKTDMLTGHQHNDWIYASLQIEKQNVSNNFKRNVNAST